MAKKWDSKKQDKPGYYWGADGSLKMIADIIKEAEMLKGVVSKERCAEVNAAYSMLIDYFKDNKDVEIACYFSDTLKNMAVINIEGPALVFDDADVLFDVVKLANNIDICGKTNGCVSFELTFYGLAKAPRR